MLSAALRSGGSTDPSALWDRGTAPRTQPVGSFELESDLLGRWDDEDEDVCPPPAACVARRCVELTPAGKEQGADDEESLFGNDLSPLDDGSPTEQGSPAIQTLREVSILPALPTVGLLRNHFQSPWTTSMRPAQVISSSLGGPLPGATLLGVSSAVAGSTQPQECTRGFARSISTGPSPDRSSFEHSAQNTEAAAAAWRGSCAHSLPRTINMSHHEDAILAHRRRVDDEDTFKPPHEMAAGSYLDTHTITHSLTRHRTIADRLKAAVFEQTGYQCSGPVTLRSGSGAQAILI